MDKRNQSKEWFADALIRLLKKKPYHQITISELSEKAQLDRRTFYRHFESKEDVLVLCVQKINKMYGEALLQLNDFSTMSIAEAFFNVCVDQVELLLLLKKRGLTIFVLNEFDKLIPLLHKKFVTDEFSLMHKENMEYILAFHTGGFWNIVNKWLDCGANKTPKELAAFVSSIVPALV